MKIDTILPIISGATVEKEKMYLRKVIGFCSLSSCGRTTIALGVAHSLVKLGYTVIYIDTSILFPKAYSYLVKKDTYYNQKGDLLDITSKEYKDIIMKTRIDNLWLLSSRNRTVIDLLSPRDNADVMIDFIDKLRDAYDFVIVDISREQSAINFASIYNCDIIYQVWDENANVFINSKNMVSYLLSMGATPYKTLRVIINKKSPRITLPTKIFSDNSFKLVAVLPGSYNVKSLGWKRQTICELSSSDKLDMEFMQNFEKIIEDIFDLFSSGNDKDTLKKIENSQSTEELEEMLTTIKSKKQLRKEKKQIKKLKKQAKKQGGDI